ncbi:MAG TPA: HAD-IC family P-type ATPase [Mycobacteriales bacterium]|nr:HAD-IC family P-type ATPase [Mycobacteriales bacterium]
MTGSVNTEPATAERGLSSAQVQERIAAGQVNVVASNASRSVGQILRANVFTRLNAIIGVLFLIILFIGPIQDGLFGLVIVANTAIGIVQELRAKRTLEQLSILGEAKPRVWRDGKQVEIAAAELVLDDEVDLGSGDKIVVDGEVRFADGLEVDESLLTGESDPVHKLPGDQLLSGSFVSAGSGSFVATRVGEDAYAAKLATEASKFTLVRSELRAGIDVILKYITYLLPPVGALIIYSQLHTGDQSVDEAIRKMIAAFVPMIPEGLVLITSVAFALGVIRLGRRQCLVQELPAIEGLARVDVVCADKTGTLTENGMRLSDVRSLGAGEAETALAALFHADPRPNQSLEAIGEAYGADPGWPVRATMPFSSARKWSGATFEGHGSWVLGAPDVLLSAADPARTQAEDIGAQGLRVLLLGRIDSAVDAADAPGPVTPVALVVLEQRIRPDARPTLEFFAEQEVQVKVISGDNARSVGAVAGTLELPGADAAVDARTLPEDAAELQERVEAGTVFGRVTPAQKRSMVGALQARGHTVAMTGDGVNDVLALKDADIGVSMGSGSPATRAVAQIVLLDNKFATLPYVVAEGRRVIGNIERVANLFLTKTIYSVTLAVLVGIASVPYPFLPRHSTIVNWFTIGIPAFFLALPQNNERAQGAFVRRIMRMALPAGVITGGCAFVSYLIARSGDHVTQEQSGTATLITLYALATFVLAMVARPMVLWKALLILAMIAGFSVPLAVPWLRDYFALDISRPALVWDALGVAAAGMVLILIAWRISQRVGAARDERDVVQSSP